MISAFKHIRLSGFNLIPQNVNGNTRLTLNNSGVAYYSELTGVSGYLQGLIDVANSDVTTINGLQNAVTVSGRDGLQVFVEGQNIVVSGNNAAVQSLITNLTTNLASTGSNLQGQINSLSGTLTGNYATITNLASTGAANLARINSLSGTLTGEYVRRATQQQFIVNLPINVESTGVTFPVVFASTPNSVQVTFEPSTDVAYMVSVKNRTTAGFTAEFSDVLFETGNRLNVFASV
jgi:hypothetical protein